MLFYYYLYAIVFQHYVTFGGVHHFSCALSKFFDSKKQHRRNVIIYLNYVKMFEMQKVIKANFMGNLVGEQFPFHSYNGSEYIWH